MESIRCKCCGHLAEANYLHQLIDKPCPDCACILLTRSQYGTLVTRKRLNPQTETKRMLIELRPYETKKVDSPKENEELPTEDELKELEELNELLDENENGYGDENRYISSLPTS